MTDPISSNTIYNTLEADLEQVAAAPEDKLFSARGRLSVLRYNARSLPLMLVTAIPFTMIAIAAPTLIGNPGLATVNPTTSTLLAAVAMILLIPLIVVGTILMIKRLHDCNMSGWFILITMIPLVGIFFLLYLILKPGTPDSNQFGLANAAPKQWEKAFGGTGIVIMLILLLVSLFTSFVDLSSLMSAVQ